MIVHLISNVYDFRTLELVKHLITKVEVFRMTERKVGIAYDPHIFGFAHIGWIG
jgi:hypothetical protein